MSSLTTLLRIALSLPTADVMLGLAITASVLVLVSNWRISMIALAAQYLLVTLLYSTIFQLEVSTVRLISGLLVAVMLYFTAWGDRRRPRRREPASSAGQEQSAISPESSPFLVGWPFRLVAITLVGISVVTLVSQFSFPGAPPLFWLLSLWLCATGLLLISITRDALKLGIGLLTFTSGFGILYLSIDPNLLFYGLLVISDLGVALAISHVASAPTRSLARRRGET